MEDIESLFDKAVDEIERMLNTKTVVGEPITIEGNTLIPLVSVGFGFGVGGGQGTEPQKGSGKGGGTGGGGGVKPIALIIINDDVGIWFGAVLRGDVEPIRVGEGTNIQEHTVLHTDSGFPLTVGKGCTVGHRAMLHGCTIGDNTLIGIGAIVMNGAKIGANSIVGAGALITEGKEFPDNSLIVGSPAKKIRDIDEQAEQMLRGSAAHYIDNWKRFTKRLKRLD